jgi:hypothetical protein
MSKQTFGRRLRSARGQAIIETALTLPIVLVLSISIFEFGRALQVWQMLTNAAREGARIAVLPGSTEAGVKDRVFQYMEAGRLERRDRDQIAIEPAEIDMGSGPVPATRVTIEYPFQFMVLGPVMDLIGTSDIGEQFTMTASALMRNE